MIDAERLAAFLDGRLDDAQRAELLEQLAASDEAMETLADVLAVTREEEPAAVSAVEAEPARVTPIGAARSARWRQALAIAAGVAGLALVPVLWQQLRDGTGDPARFAAALAPASAALPPAWDYNPWTTTRSAAEALSPRARAIRLGARLTDLELALATNDTLAAAVAQEIAELLQGVALAGPVRDGYLALARGEGASAPDPRRVGERVGEDDVELGAWLEAARLSAAAGDAAFLRTRASRSMVDRALNRPDLDAPSRAALGRVSAVADSRSLLDAQALRADLDDILARLGS